MLWEEIVCIEEVEYSTDNPVCEYRKRESEVLVLDAGNKRWERLKFVTG